MTAALRERAGNLAAWWRRADTVFRLYTFGRAELTSSPHEPLPDPAWPGVCAVDGEPLDDPLLHRRQRRGHTGTGRHRR